MTCSYALPVNPLGGSECCDTLISATYLCTCMYISWRIPGELLEFYLALPGATPAALFLFQLSGHDEAGLKTIGNAPEKTTQQPSFSAILFRHAATGPY